MRTSLILLLVSTFPLFTKANMSDPVTPGTLGASAYCASYVDILSETIRVILDEKGMNARYEIEYHIRSDSSGIQVPLLFYAFDLGHREAFREDFQVWIDGEPIEILPLPQDYGELVGPAWAVFDHVFHNYQSLREGDKTSQMVVYLPKSDGEADLPIPVSDLRYFETDISQGEHKIQVSYTAKHWEDRYGYTKDIYFRYALSPANTWRSFGRLEITLDARACDSKAICEVVSNLGAPISGDTRSIAKWKFSSIPVSVMEIGIRPCLSKKSEFLLRQGSLSFLIVGAVLLFLLQLGAMWLYRRKHVRWAVSWVNLLGSFIGLIGIGYLFLMSPDWISGTIPSEFRGWGEPYLFFAIVLNPAATLAFSIGYLFINSVIDSRLRKHYRRKSIEKAA